MKAENCSLTKAELHQLNWDESMGKASNKNETNIFETGVWCWNISVVVAWDVGLWEKVGGRDL